MAMKSAATSCTKHDPAKKKRKRELLHDQDLAGPREDCITHSESETSGHAKKKRGR